jgi:hypothetical protein
VRELGIHELLDRANPDPGLEIAASTLAAVVDRGREMLDVAGSSRR